jgi:hypothetical protein
MGNKADIAKQKALEAQNAAYQTAFNTQVTAAKTPSPYEQALTKEGTDWIDATNGSKPMDISTLPGMSPYLDLYNRASSDQKQQRFGLGSLRFGAEQMNPNLLAEITAQDKAHRTQEAGGELENAFNARNAAVRGLAMPLVSTDAARQEGVLNAVGNQASGARSAYANFTPQPSFWSTLLQSTARNLGSWAGPQSAAKGATIF